MKHARVVVTGAIAVVAGGVAALVLLSTRGDDQPPTETTLVSRGDLDEMASLSGTVKADVQVEVKSRASGEVTEVAVQVGDSVEAGDLLVRLDPVDEERLVHAAQAALSAVRAQLAQARAALAVARTEAREAAARSAVRDRAAQRGLVSAEERRSTESAAASAAQTVTLREADVGAARAQIERARLDLDEARTRLQETTVRAPIAGTVLSVAVEQGTIVSSGITNIGGGTPVLTLGDLSTLYVVGALDEADVGRVHHGQEVAIRVDAYPDEQFAGRVERIAPLGTTTSNVVTFDVDVRVTDPHADRLLPGMSADLEVVTARHEDVPLVPAAAIRSDGRQRYVLLDSGERRDVQVLGTDGVHMAVSGVEGGDRVVVSEVTAREPSRRGLFGPRR